jgi:hypothetical protein
MIALVVVFALGFGAGYAVRERKSRMRRRLLPWRTIGLT